MAVQTPNICSMPVRAFLMSAVMCLVAPRLLLNGTSTVENSVLGFVLPHCGYSLSRRPSSSQVNVVDVARDTLLSLLRSGEKDNSPSVAPHVDALVRAYSESTMDARYCGSRDDDAVSFCGDWVNAAKVPPEFPGRVAVTDEGLPVYTVGRLTFSQIPSETARNVPCVVTQMVQKIHPLSSHEESPPMNNIPKELHAHYQSHRQDLRTNTIDTFFRIPNSPVRGILRTKGYALPCAIHKNRWNKWFVGGVVLPMMDDDDDDDCDDDEYYYNATRARIHGREEWERVFGTTSSSELSYSLPTLVVAHQTVVYLDETFRIGIGNRGTAVLLVKQRKSSKIRR